jgi:formylglycine-generating enzyme required for sulfatase activity
MLVSNGEYLAFVEEGGYAKPEYWTEEGQRWLKAIKPTAPLFWNKVDNIYKLRTLTRLIDMPWDWPVEITNLEARAFCTWKSMNTGSYYRLPTEDEYYAIRNALGKDLTNWEYQ